jgi:hypothetical protein
MSATTTVNFTGAVDRALLRRAKVIAAQNDTSINALLMQRRLRAIRIIQICWRFLLGSGIRKPQWTSWALTVSKTCFY